MKWILIIGGIGGGYLYLRSQGIDLATSSGWSALGSKFGTSNATPGAGGAASPCTGCKNAATTPATYSPVYVGGQ